ncbi:hypothetical protein COS91_07150 [Candidatus Desantisbacteria bacterium CG07_land_8_20_14_0_80_39_15]|uniref:Xylose isomerase-like TIM barrel domain-containing protein n=1 Tax=Candidatus Desantisbacteria bacterium CG07_land_8_20_14_0_80_39_15 TaxID=1974549 RepID=A0A2M6ZEV6_9BACT|nr:MAG: hypothetical protein COS91_07150 [Candidatus Desantisbacteria bacterium CG07_land_8_20_14_0_80_39_15]
MRTCINEATTMPYSLQEDIVFAHKAKFEGIEIWYDKLKKFLEGGNTPAKLQELLWGAELEPAALCGFPLITFSDNEQAIQELVKAAQIAPQIDCGMFLVYPGDSQPAGMSKADAIRKAAGALRVYGEAIKPYKIRIAFEPTGMHPYVPGPLEALEIINLAGSENLGIMIDTFHYYKSGVSLEDIRAIPIEKLFIVHVNDSENLPLEQLTDGHRLYTGLGVIPLVEEFKILKEKGYKGFLSVEIFRDEYWKESPEKIMLDAKKNLDAVLAKI